MMRSTASVAVDRPGRYGKQLVSHLSRKTGGHWSDAEQSGWIALGTALVHVRADYALELVIEADEATQLVHLEEVVGHHLVRFGSKEDVSVRWLRQDGSAGTEQHRDDPQ